MTHTPDDPTQAQVWITKGLDELDFEFYFPQGPKGDPGGFTPGTDLLTSDLNDIKTAGLYRQPSGAQATALRNYPEVNGGILTVMEMAGTSYVIQSWSPITGGSSAGRVRYQREFATPNWSPWRAIVANRVDQTAGRAIYTWDILNNREQLVYGDTGLRDVSASYENGWVTGTPAVPLTLQRYGSTVSLTGYLTRGGATSKVYTVPTGFRPENFRTFPVLYNYSATPSGIHVMDLTAAGAVNIYGTTAGPLYVNATWQTNQAWPTTLPGSAIGTIPNL